MRRRVYPRPCGEACSSIEDAVQPIPRSIPARAGKPCSWVPRSLGLAVYPKPRTPRSPPMPLGLSPPVRGSRRDPWGLKWRDAEGLSPPVRGSHRILRDLLETVGSIPARAGKPCSTPAGPSNWESGLSPPVRGSPVRQQAPEMLPEGLSPPVRGSLPEGPSRTGPGSIPARAGKPPRLANRSSITSGLSPPVRGSRQTCQFRCGYPRGSIPARAGKPLATWRTARINWVPRCGILDALLLEWQLL